MTPSPGVQPTHTIAKPLVGRASLRERWATMAHVAIAMMFHDRLKLIGTLAGVFFAVVLSNQQAGTFLGLLRKNTMFVDHSNADIWIVPPDTFQLVAGRNISDAVLNSARSTPGVAWAEPLLFGVTTMVLPEGGTEQVTLVGTKAPRFPGGPWNMVVGSPEVLLDPDTMIFEDSQREKYGNLSLGSWREVGGYRVRAGGFTWGLLPFAPAYAFADLPLARRILNVPTNRQTFVLAGVQPGVSVDEVAAQLQKRVPEVKVVSRDRFRREIVNYLLTQTAIGVSFGTSTMFGLIIGFVTVSLSMFSSVVDNIRQFGTLKAIGSTTSDLAKLLIVQSVIFALLGSLIGIAAVVKIAEATRSPKLAIVLPPQMLAGTVVLMILLCVSASCLSLLRLRKVEPGMVFR
jgi:putative ABC transport system permease protein